MAVINHDAPSPATQIVVELDSPLRSTMSGRISDPRRTIEFHGTIELIAALERLVELHDAESLDPPIHRKQ